MADDFREQMKIQSALWVDTKKLVYRQLPFTRGYGSVYNPRAAIAAARALSKGFMQGFVQGDPKQNGGVLVARQGGECVYAYGSAFSGDKPPIADVLKVAREQLTR